MNPDLQKLWDNVVTAYQNAQKAGDSLSPGDIDQYLQSQSGGKYSLRDITKPNLRNLGRSFLEGLTANWADELASGKAQPSELAGLAAGADAALPGTGAGFSLAREAIGKLSALFGGSPAIEASMRLSNAAFHEAHPVLDTGAQIAGSVAPALLTAGGSELPTTAAQAIGRGAATGTAFGAVSGAGAGTDLASRGEGAVMGGATGAALGAAIPAVVGAYKYVRSPEARALRYLRGMTGESGGVEAMRARAGQFATAGKGDLVTLADLSPQYRALADMAATGDPTAAAQIEQLASTRQAGMSQRLKADAIAGVPDLTRGATRPLGTIERDYQAAVSDLEKLMPGNRPSVGPAAPEEITAQTAKVKALWSELQAARKSPVMAPDATTKLDALNKQLNDWAAGPEGYGGLRAANPTVPNTVFPKEISQTDLDNIAGLKTLIEQGGGNASPATLQMLSELESKVGGGLNSTEKQLLDVLTKPKVASALKDAQQAGLIQTPISPTDAPTLDKLIMIKNKIDGLAGAAFKKGNGYLGNALVDAKTALEDHLTQNVPGYSAVARQYAIGKDLMRKIGDGQDVWNSTDNEGLQQLVKSLNPDQLEMFRYGMASELNSKLNNASTNIDFAHRLLNSSITKDEKLQILFGNEANFTRFMQQAELESEMAKLRGTYTGSATGRRMVAMNADPVQTAVQGAQSGMVSGAHLSLLKSAAVRALAKITNQRLSAENARALTPYLMTKGTPAIDALLQKFANPGPIMGNTPTALLPAAAGQTAGSLFGGGSP